MDRTLVERLEAAAKKPGTVTVDLLREAAAALRATTGEGEWPTEADIERACAAFGLSGLTLSHYLQHKYMRRALLAIAPPPPLQDAGAVATLLASDPYDDSGSEGPWMHMHDWKRLRELPAGTKLYVHPTPAQPVATGQGECPKCEADEAKYRESLADDPRLDGWAPEPFRKAAPTAPLRDAGEVEEHVAVLRRLEKALPEVGLNGWFVGVKAVRFAIEALTHPAPVQPDDTLAWFDALVADSEDAADRPYIDAIRAALTAPAQPVTDAEAKAARKAAIDACVVEGAYFAPETDDEWDAVVRAALTAAREVKP